MIERTSSYKTSDGTICATIEAAQEHELELLVADVGKDQIPMRLVNEREKVVDILTTRPNSKPRARKINGAQKKRKAAVPAQPEAAK